MAIAKAYEYFLSCINDCGSSVEDAISETVYMFSHEGVGEDELIDYIKVWGEVEI